MMLQSGAAAAAAANAVNAANSGCENNMPLWLRVLLITLVVIGSIPFVYLFISMTLPTYQHLGRKLLAPLRFFRK